MSMVKLGLSSSTFALAAALSSAAHAQSVTLPIPPVRSHVDERGVDITSSQVQASETDLTIGSSTNPTLAHHRFWAGQYGWRHDYIIAAKLSGTDVTVSIGPNSDNFKLSGSTYTSDEGNGATLSETSTSYTYTAGDGTIVQFDKTLAANNASYYGAVAAVATSITTPTGLKTTLTYKRTSYTVDYGGGFIVTMYMLRLQSVQNSVGYQLKYSYVSDATTNPDAWSQIASVKAINNAVDYCDPAADICSGFTQSWPTVTYSTATVGANTQESVANPAGRIHYNTVDSSGRLVAIRQPGASSDTIGYTYGSTSSSYTIAAAVAGAGTWNYSFSNLNAYQKSVSIIAPGASTSRVLTVHIPTRLVQEEYDETGARTAYVYDGSGRLNSITAPDLNTVTYTPDTRGNVTSVVVRDKSYSNPLTVSTATYPASCSIIATCNKPTQTTDLTGNATAYVYNANGT